MFSPGPMGLSKSAYQNMKNWPILIIVALAAFIVYLLLQSEPPPPDVKPHEDSIRAKQREMDSLIDRQQRLERELKEDSTEHAREAQSLKREIWALKQEVKKKDLRTAKVHELDSLKDTIQTTLSDTTYCLDLNQARELFSKSLKFDTQALLIDKQDSLITLMEKDKVVTWAKFNQILDNEREKFKVSQEINEHMEEITSIYKDTDNKLRRQNKLLKFSLPIVAVGVFVLSQ